MAKTSGAKKFKLQKHTSGVCHRCGWRGPVVKVGRRDRVLLHTSEGYRRLCDDCTDALLSHHGSTSGTALRSTGEEAVTGNTGIA